jgi:hypothetical protein
MCVDAYLSFDGRPPENTNPPVQPLASTSLAHQRQHSRLETQLSGPGTPQSPSSIVSRHCFPSPAQGLLSQSRAGKECCCIDAKYLYISGGRVDVACLANCCIIDQQDATYWRRYVYLSWTIVRRIVLLTCDLGHWIIVAQCVWLCSFLLPATNCFGRRYPRATISRGRYTMTSAQLYVYWLLTLAQDT